VNCLSAYCDHWPTKPPTGICGHRIQPHTKAQDHANNMAGLNTVCLWTGTQYADHAAHMWLGCGRIFKRAAVFWTDCNFLISPSPTLDRRLLQIAIVQAAAESIREWNTIMCSMFPSHIQLSIKYEAQMEHCLRNYYFVPRLTADDYVNSAGLALAIC